MQYDLVHGRAVFRQRLHALELLSRQQFSVRTLAAPGFPETRLPESFLLGEEQNRRYGIVGHDAGLGYCGREGHTMMSWCALGATDSSASLAQRISAARRDMFPG